MIDRSEWVIQGDRSHPNLVKLDGLRLSYPGWEEDFLAAERSHVAGGMSYDIELFKLEESQRMHNGDRSHSRLVELDSLKLFYPGCEQDVRDVERKYHLGYGERGTADLLFQRALEGLKNKQQMFSGDRSHPILKELDELKLSYPGWENDFEAVEKQHKLGMFAVENRLHTLKEKQDIHEGRRSHWRLKKLDSLKLSYPGWQEDVEDAEDFHIRNNDKGLSNYIFESKLQGMKNRQDMFMGNRSHPNLVSLYELNPTYPGWRDDFNDALVAHGKGGMKFGVKLHKLKQKQRLHDGDRSHWRVVEIDSLDLSYPGWQDDIRNLKENHLNNDEGSVANYRFKSYVTGIRNKQMMYMGYSNEQQQEEDEQYGNEATNVNGVDEEDASNLGLCVACAAQPKSCAFVPCGHVSLCESCSSKSMSTTTRCPICRQPAEKFVKIHVC